MFLPLELAPLVFQFLPYPTFRKFPKDDPLLIAVLKIQDGCRPFKVTYDYFGALAKPSVEHMGVDLNEAFSKEVLLSLRIVHKVQFSWILVDTFDSLFCKNDKADDSFPFSRTLEVEILRAQRYFTSIDLSLFPKLRKLGIVDPPHSGITISPKSRTMLLNCIAFQGGGSTVDGVCDVSRDEYVIIDMNKDCNHGFIKLCYSCVEWKPCFDRSWCRSMELQKVSYSKHTLATLEGFANLKDLKFVEAKIELSQDWLPNLPLEALSFRYCHIRGTEIGFCPHVKKLEFRLCSVLPLKGYFPQLESLIFLESSFQHYTGAEDEENEPDYPSISVPIAKENIRKVKSFYLWTPAKRFDMFSFEELKDLKVSCSDQLTRLDGLNVDTLERVTIKSCPNLKVEFPSHVSLRYVQTRGMAPVYTLSPSLPIFP